MNSPVTKKKLFISNLDFEVTSEQLSQLFEEIGATVSVVVASDRETKRSKGFAFVEMEREEDARTAIETLNNRAKIAARTPVQLLLKVAQAREDVSLSLFLRFNACSSSSAGVSWIPSQRILVSRSTTKT